MHHQNEATKRTFRGHPGLEACYETFVTWLSGVRVSGGRGCLPAHRGRAPLGAGAARAEPSSEDDGSLPSLRMTEQTRAQSAEPRSSCNPLSGLCQ